MASLDSLKERFLSSYSQETSAGSSPGTIHMVLKELCEPRDSLPVPGQGAVAGGSRGWVVGQKQNTFVELFGQNTRCL